MKEYLFFDKMITPVLINILFWIMALGAVISGLGMMKFSFFSGLGTLIVGVIGARIFCELMLVIFGMHSSLKELVRLQKGESSETDSTKRSV